MVPCVEDGSKQYVCPRNGDALEETDGTGFRDWFNDQNRITEGNLKRTVRLLKFLRDHKGNFSIPSVILTALAGEAIKLDDDGAEAASTMADTVATVLTRIDERLEKCDQIPVIVNPDTQNFRRLMGIYASTARKARHQMLVEQRNFSGFVSARIAGSVERKNGWQLATLGTPRPMGKGT